MVCTHKSAGFRVNVGFRVNAGFRVNPPENIITGLWWVWLRRPGIFSNHPATLFYFIFHLKNP
jgi:hypothetical protein